MANRLLPSRYVEVVHRLALGIEAVDALRAGRIAPAIRITFDEIPLGLKRSEIMRHDSAVFALLYDASIEDTIVVRLFDGSDARWSPKTDRRRFVPRRLRVPLLAVDEADDQPVARRARRPALFPGAAYDVADCVTGMRGSVVAAGEPLRWARVQAVEPVSGATVGRAHCDDRGEFLLLIDSAASGLAELSDPLELDLRVHVPIVPVVSPAVRDQDALFDLPIEDLPAPGAADSVSPGELPWPQWTPGATTPVAFPLGTILRGHAPLAA
ncbi:MAG TPA: hypothetical protein VE907_07130 [Gammaproteobacteria bacterium]|nr:hypothetical protein [Gammaproteobacteria bacterium]